METGKKLVDGRDVSRIFIDKVFKEIVYYSTVRIYVIGLSFWTF